MSDYIYVKGELDLCNASPRQVEKIRKIKNGWGSPAFAVENRHAYLPENISGLLPLDDGILTPFRELAKYARKNGFNIPGGFFVTSTSKDYNGLYIYINNDGKVTVEDAPLAEESNESLRKELYRRELDCKHSFFTKKQKAVAGILYQAYKEDWKRTQLSMDDILKAYSEYFDMEMDSADEPLLCNFEDYIFEQGYSGSLYVCFDEFCGAELLDREYIKYLAAGNKGILSCMEEYWKKVEEEGGNKNAECSLSEKLLNLLKEYALDEYVVSSFEEARANSRRKNIVLLDDGIYITFKADIEGEVNVFGELVCWVEDEFIEDPSLPEKAVNIIDDLLGRTDEMLNESIVNDEFLIRFARYD